MKIKRIIAGDMREAMRQVRQLFGDDAVILSNRPCPEGVELVAAIDFDEQAIRRDAGRQAPYRVAGTSPVDLAPPSRLPPEKSAVATEPNQVTADLLAARQRRQMQEQLSVAEQAVAQVPAGPSSAAEPIQDPFAEALAEFNDSKQVNSSSKAQSSAARAEPRDLRGHWRETSDTKSPAALNELKAEVGQLRALFERQLDVLEWHRYSAAHPAELETCERLETLGIPKGLAKKLAQDAARQEPDRALSAALKSLGEDITAPAQSAFMQGGMFAFIGPTGVGKTTTLAKIAAQAVLAHGRDSVALITTDRFRIGAQEQLRNYARILNIPLHVARDEQHLAELLPAVSSKRLVLIDTAGMSPRDMHMMDALKKLPVINERLNVLLVLSAQAQYSAMTDAINRFQVLPLAGMILTKLDETILLGSALAALIHGGLPLVCTGVGQRVPEDLWYPTTADLIKQAIELGQGERARADSEYSASQPASWSVGA
ncbi:flagellar biosynthesis protein FlhF [Halothiobacillus sp.]|uniref:flagellar biosynthesis protein FlhF n=1 Tax=Halothiobacillus sp. TaxID=1891311 RepID=UPI00261772C5|nr:flagellar biosynthesis protein FlhF [Halothiobacillus sp.]MDD4966764.1 flagellar biosynthesis protein FlhF [Halothiobacillus sp.]